MSQVEDNKLKGRTLLVNISNAEFVTEQQINSIDFLVNVSRSEVTSRMTDSLTDACT